MHACSIQVSGLVKVARLRSMMMESQSSPWLPPIFFSLSSETINRCFHDPSPPPEFLLACAFRVPIRWTAGRVITPSSFLYPAGAKNTPSMYTEVNNLSFAEIDFCLCGFQNTQVRKIKWERGHQIFSVVVGLVVSIKIQGYRLIQVVLRLCLLLARKRHLNREYSNFCHFFLMLSQRYYCITVADQLVSNFIYVRG